MMTKHVGFVISALLVCVLLATPALGAPQRKGTIEDVEHVVIFMQENRAFDHYYGTLDGVRGFNDRAAPPLPNGKPVWYQPAVAPTPNPNALCGCMSCDLQWTDDGAEVKSIIESLPCVGLQAAMAFAKPPVSIKEGELCSDWLSQLLQSSIDGYQFSSALKSTSSCPASAKISGTLNDDASTPSVPHASNESYILPFNLQFDKTAASCMPAPQMAYASDINIFNRGRMDAWNTARLPGFGMSYFNRSDLPYYYALADAFTISDQYYQSTFTATNPNREHLFSGSNGLSVPNSGFDMLDDTEPTPGFNWETMPETLLKANISWRILKGYDDFDDDATQWFANFQTAKPGSPLYDLTQPVPDLLEAWEDLVANDKLPQVMWIVGPTALSEHATNHPADGEDLSHRLIEVLSRPENAAVYAKTLFVLNYDEGGQFVDHLWPPTPPISAADGKSTVTTVGELTIREQFGIPAGHPIGLGFRVPMFLISPWTRGHYVFSQVSDHTSTIKFIEKRFGVHCPNISPWRRAVVSDLTAAFDFQNPDYSWPSSFPSTSQNINQSEWQCENLPSPTIPSIQHLPIQEPGIRKSRSLPYEFQISDSVSDSSITLTMKNTGAAGAVFHVFNNFAPTAFPRKYTVEAGKALEDVWSAGVLTGNMYNISLYGPNGFVRHFVGSTNSSVVAASVRYDTAGQDVEFFLELSTPEHASPIGSCSFLIRDNAYHSGGPWKSDVAVGGAPSMQSVSVSRSGNWYDVTVELADQQSDSCPLRGMTFLRRYMGRMEAGAEGTSDPAMSGPQAWHAAEPEHPLYPEHFRHVAWDAEADCSSRRSRLKDQCWTAADQDAMIARAMSRSEL